MGIKPQPDIRPVRASGAARVRTAARLATASLRRPTPASSSLCGGGRGGRHASMAILQSCCCWRSVRMGSYASAAYTTAYFSVMVVIMGRVLHEERQYLQGYVPAPQTTSVLEAGPISPATMCLTVAVLACASCGVIASLLLFYGLYTDRRLLLVPWILVVAANLLLDLAHVVTTIAIGALTFNPLTAFLFTIDFFLITLNVYALLCVVSQFQEYKAGRGTAADDQCIRHVSITAALSAKVIRNV
ncbi:uncharacterized protein LOC126188451 [Schistocerca cancellata]|uniref:uncharacterized protein LOC126188451 n=1 Tax=Schistocerca cancellata TaxID=274614 RepID=UPI00211739FE|nr:uncharacterized protein LOC126188451 [Schistocerca cancellata]